jgi:hypothetical protein
MSDVVRAVAHKGDGEENEDRMYTVKKVLDWSYVRSQNRIFYKVVYAREDGSLYPPSLQPLEDLTTCPLLVAKYELRVFTAYKKKVKERFHRKKAPIPGFIKQKNRILIPNEHVPHGREQRVQILSESVERISSRKSDTFFHVLFDLSDSTVPVRRLFMEYYYPLQLLKYYISRSAESRNEEREPST